MHLLKKIFSSTTGYWIHKKSTLPVGTDIFIDIHNRLNYGPLNTMFDVGANLGQTWEWFRNSEAGAKIYCFEPVAETFKVLEKKTENDKNCILENIALGNVAGEKIIRLFEGEYSALNSLKEEVMNSNIQAKEEIITIETLDNYCFKNKISKIDFLKIDTEGYEMNVLEGAKNMLNTGNVSFIFCEVGFLKENIRNTYFADLTEWLAKKEYYFNGLYQLVSNDYKIEFGNAMYVHKDIFQR